MEEQLSERLKKLADLLHFLGKNQEANILIDLAVICQVKNVQTSEDLKDYRKNCELV